jgi:hypothetical protein
MEEELSASALASDQYGGKNQMTAAKIIEEFQSLLDKSQKLFTGLRFTLIISFFGNSEMIFLWGWSFFIIIRDLPPTGGHKQWHPYFQRTFEVYTKVL